MTRAAAVQSPLAVSIFVEGLRARPAVLVALALIAYAAIWTVTAWITDPTPDPGIAVGLALGREWRLGYVDTPPLAPWILELAYRAGGVRAAQALGPITIALAGWLVFGLARRIVGDRHGALATFVMVGVHPVAFPAGAFDADLLQMPLVALAALAWWQAVAERNRLAWMVLGLACIGLAYAGVQGVFVFATLVLLTLATPTGLSAFRVYDSQLASVAGLFVFTLVLTPRLLWLQRHGFAGATIAPYTEADALARAGALDIGLTVLVGHIGLLLLAAVASPLRAGDREVAPGFLRPPLPRLARVTVMVLALLPPALAFGAAFATGARFPVAAAAPLLLYSGLLLVVLAGSELRIHRQRAVAVAALTLLLLPPILEVAAAFASPWMSSAGRASNWPARAAGRYITDVYRTRTGQPLGIIVGEPRTASTLALASSDRPRVFLNADPVRAPWLDRERVAARGAVVVWPIEGADAAPPAALTERLPAFVPEAPVVLPWVRPGSLNRVRLGWAIIPPAR